jgi:iron complex outermembrane recepter protein
VNHGQACRASQPLHQFDAGRRFTDLHEPGDRPEAHCNAAEGSRSHGLFRSPSLSHVEPSTFVRARGVRRENCVKSSVLLAGSGLFLLYALPAAAADPVTSEPITVTATRFATGLSNSPVNVTVLDEQDIARSGTTSITELLQQQAGVQVLDLYGVSGAKSRIDMGGFGASGGENTLVLLNGRRLNDVDLAGANLAALPLASIARVEILHGSGSVLYGDNAVGGVINIITKTGFEGPTAAVEARVGSYSTYGLAVTGNARSTDAAVTVSAQGLSSDGYRDNSASRQRGLVAEITRLAGERRYGLRAGASSEALDLPGPLNEPLYLSNPRASTYDVESSDSQQRSAELYLSGPDIAGELGLRSKKQNAQLYGTTAADLETVSFTPRYSTALWHQSLVTGVDAYRSTLSTQATFTGASNSSDASRSSVAIYLTDAFELDSGFGINLGFRYQSVALDMTNVDQLTSSQSGATRTDQLNAWDATLAWRQGKTRAYVRAAESFRFPVLDEMWSYYTGSITLLNPQTSQHVELGLSTALGPTTLDANLFRILLNNEIGYNAATYANENLDPTRHSGFDVGWRAALGERASVRLGWTYRDASFRAGTYNGNTIPEIPRNSVTLVTDWRVTERQQLGLDGVYTGERFFGNDYANVGKSMPSNSRWKLHYTYAPATWKLRLTIDNLTNVSSADIGYYYYDSVYSPNPYYYYPLPGRSVTCSLEKSF